MATYLPSRKLSKLDESDMQDTSGEARTSSLVMFSYGLPHMAEQMQGDQLTPTYRISEDTGCRPEDLPEAMNDWDEWLERVRNVCAGGTTR